MEKLKIKHIVVHGSDIFVIWKGKKITTTYLKTQFASGLLMYLNRKLVEPLSAGELFKKI